MLESEWNFDVQTESTFEGSSRSLVQTGSQVGEAARAKESHAGKWRGSCEAGLAGGTSRRRRSLITSCPTHFMPGKYSSVSRGRKWVPGCDTMIGARGHAGRHFLISWHASYITSCPATVLMSAAFLLQLNRMTTWHDVSACDIHTFLKRRVIVHTSPVDAMPRFQLVLSRYEAMFFVLFFLHLRLWGSSSIVTSYGDLMALSCQWFHPQLGDTWVENVLHFGDSELFQ